MTQISDQEINTVPYSKTDEEAVNGSILINPDSYYEVAKFITSDDFYLHKNKWIFSAFAAMFEKKIPIDLLTLSTQLENYGKLDEIGGSAYLTYLINVVPSSLNIVAYARVVEEKSIRRKMIAAANKIATLAYAQNDDVIANYSQGKKAYDGVFSESGDFVSMHDMVNEHYDRMEKRAQGGDEYTLKTGFTSLDAVLDGGLRNGDFVIVAGRPGMGKTAFMLDIARNIAKIYPSKNVGAISLEMSKEQYLDRLITKYGIPMSHIRKCRLEESEWSIYTHAIEDLSNLGIFVDDASSITPASLRAKARALSNLHGLDVLIVDYIGLMESGSKKENDTAEISALSRAMKILARELDIPVICAAQLNRNLEARQNKRPILSDLRSSGSLEQDADIVMFLYRDFMYSGENPDIAEVNIAKQRNGRTETIELSFEGELMKFGNINQKTIYLNKRQTGEEND